MRRLGAGLVLAAILAAMPAMCQTSSPAVPQTAIVVLDQEQLFGATRYGRALQAKFDADAAALLAENRKIDAALEAEERELTDSRAKMAPEDFRPLADAFDVKANELRSAQEAKSRDLARQRDELRQSFFRSIGPIIGDYMIERGAVAVLDKASVIVSLGTIDITKDVIAQIDARLGDGAELAKP